MADRHRRVVEDLLATAGVEVGGERPWDLRVHEPAFFRRVLAGGSLALGESYMDGWWDCGSLDQLFHRALSAGLQQRVRRPGFLLHALAARLFNPQRRSRAFDVGRQHYDLGNDLYERMLDRRMNYSCAYWRWGNGNEAPDLDVAQEAKLDLACRKLGLRSGMHVLDVGCGWGGAAAFAAEHYGVEVLGMTVSERQKAWSDAHHAHLPVEVRLADYRDLPDTLGDHRFDRVLSIGMFEHVGQKNYRRFFQVVRQLLADDGLFLLHSIGGNTSVARTDRWIGKYIFPRSMLPSAAQITKGYEGLFVLEDWHSFGADYDPTLMAWHANLQPAWPDLIDRYGDRFRRMWNYYLLSCAGSFRARKNQLWQIVLSPQGVEGGYRCVR